MSTYLQTLAPIFTLGSATNGDILDGTGTASVTINIADTANENIVSQDSYEVFVAEKSLQARATAMLNEKVATGNSVLAIDPKSYYKCLMQDANGTKIEGHVAIERLSFDFGVWGSALKSTITVVVDENPTTAPWTATTLNPGVS